MPRKDRIISKKAPKYEGQRTKGRRGQRPGAGMATYNPFAMIEGTVTGHSFRVMRGTPGKVKFTMETDIANWLILIKEVLNILINDKLIDKWNATQQESLAYQIIYGAELLFELKAQMNELAYLPTLTRTDAGVGAPWTIPTLDDIVNVVTNNYTFPVLSYFIADLFSTCIQVNGSQPFTNYPAAYFIPFPPYLTSAEYMTLLGTYDAKYEAVVYATQCKMPMVKPTRDMIVTVHEEPMASQFAEWICKYYPVSDDAGVTSVLMDATTQIAYSMIPGLEGVPEYYLGNAFMRGTAVSEYCIIMANAAANKLSVQTATVGATSFTDVADNVSTADWLRNAATSRAVEMLSIWSSNAAVPYGAIKAAGHVSSAAEWNRYLAIWLARKAVNPTVVNKKFSLLPDFLTSGRRASANTAGPTGPDWGPGLGTQPPNWIPGVGPGNPGASPNPLPHQGPPDWGRNPFV